MVAYRTFVPSVREERSSCAPGAHTTSMPTASSYPGRLHVSPSTDSRSRSSRPERPVATALGDCRDQTNLWPTTSAEAGRMLDTKRLLDQFLGAGEQGASGGVAQGFDLSRLGDVAREFG